MPSFSPDLRLIPPAASTDSLLVSKIVQMINLAFEETEGDLLVPGIERTSAAEIARLIAHEELHGAFDEDRTPVGVIRVHQLAHVDNGGGTTARSQAEDAITAAEAAEQNSTSGSHANGDAPTTKTATENQTASLPRQRIFGPVTDRSLQIGAFGMLAVHSSHRGTGLGRRLTQYAEAHAAALGCAEMEIALLVPAEAPSHAFKDRLTAWYARLGYVIVQRLEVDACYPGVSVVFNRRCECEVSRKRLGHE
jgi:GNAT superfamily N-acetyltransferase